MGYSHYKKSHRKLITDQVERTWHECYLSFVRSQKCNGEDTSHFKTRAKQRGINGTELETLRMRGELYAIEIGSDDPHCQWKPKYILQSMTDCGQVIEGVFAIDGYNLQGITCYFL